MYVPIISQFDTVLSMCREYARYRCKECSRKDLFWAAGRALPILCLYPVSWFSVATWKSNQVWYKYRRRSRIEAKQVSHMCGQNWDRMAD